MGSSAQHHHEHLDNAGPGLLLGAETIHLSSLGLDVGSATSHLAVVDLELERVNGTYEVISRSVTFRSPVGFTPYRRDGLIDAGRLGSFVRAQWEAARNAVGAVDISVALMTGAAALPENLAALEQLGGPGLPTFLSVCAGDRLEAELAAHGSGAVGASLDGRTVLNIDIGGATTKFSWCRNGRIAKVETYDFGSRMVVLDTGGRIVQLNSAGQRIAQLCGLKASLDAVLTEPERRRMAARLAEGIITVAGLVPAGTGWERVFRRNASAGERVAPDDLVISGGVAALLADRDQCAFGDLGDAIAVALASRLGQRGVSYRVPAEAIRSTALGVSKFAVQVGGATVTRHQVALPLRDVPVVRLDPDLMSGDFGGVAEYLRERRGLFDAATGSRLIAVMLPWRGSITYGRLDKLAAALLRALRDPVSRGDATILLVDKDIGQLLGRHLLDVRGLNGSVLVIDGLELRDYDFVDISASEAEPDRIMVTVKSLEFQANEAAWIGQPARRASQMTA